MAHPDPIASVRSFMLPETGADVLRSVSVESTTGPPPDTSPGDSPDDEDRWSALRTRNPRLHDGPILSVRLDDWPSRELSCRVDSYKRFTIQETKRASLGSQPDPFDPAGIWLLGVKGWIIARDRAGDEHLLIARRGPDTRIYGMMWESAPAGGVAPPSRASDSHSVRITHDMLRRSLSAECEEELGLDLDWTASRLIALTQDSIARSYDIHLRLDLPTAINPNHAPVCSTGERSWEYVDTAWLSRRDAPAFDRASGGAITPPTRVMLRSIGWVLN